MRFLPLCALVLGLFACSNSAVAEEIALETEEQKVLYAVGQAVARQIAPLEFTQEELDFVLAGLRDAATGAEPRIDMAVYSPKLEASMRTRATQLTQKEKERGQTYCDSMAQEDGAEKLSSGMVFQQISEGDGPSPEASDRVKVHYHGTLRDGGVFDTTQGKDPATFAVGGVIPCFSEGLMKLKVGGKAKLTCPSTIAYGDRGSPPKIRPGAALTFEVELVEIVAKPAPTATTPVP